MNSKNEYNIKIGSRLQAALKTMELSQKNLLDRCISRDYKISQSSLSKLLSGASVQPLHVAQICDVLNLNLSEIMSLDEDTEIHYPTQASPVSDHIVVDAKHSAFRAYKGKFHGYFYTTKSEELLHHGIFEISEDRKTHRCVASFEFKTGEVDKDGKEIKKKYIGSIIYSISMQAFYCELRSVEIGEICYLLFHYDFLAYQVLESRLAAVITISSGVKRLPTMHKLLLTREALDDTDLKYMTGQLRLNNSEILISENAYRGFINDELLADTKFFDYFGNKETEAEGFTSNVAKVNYYMLNESLISDSYLPPDDKVKIISLLRGYSASPRNNKISAKAEENIFRYLQFKKKKTSSRNSEVSSDNQ